MLRFLLGTSISSINDYNGLEQQNEEVSFMEILLLLVYGVIGGASTLVLAIGLPAVLCWKCYRKVKYHIPLTQ